MKIRKNHRDCNKEGVDYGNMIKNEVIRDVQRAEGDADCFARLNVNDCNQMNCLWRGECSNALSKTLTNKRKDHKDGATDEL